MPGLNPFCDCLDKLTDLNTDGIYRVISGFKNQRLELSKLLPGVEYLLFHAPYYYENASVHIDDDFKIM